MSIITDILDKNKDYDEIYGPRIIRVYCPGCDKWIDEATVEILDCEEGSMGEDVVTFTCKCGRENKSRRIG